MMTSDLPEIVKQMKLRETKDKKHILEKITSDKISKIGIVNMIYAEHMSHISSSGSSSLPEPKSFFSGSIVNCCA